MMAGDDEWTGDNLVTLDEAKRRRFSGPDAPELAASNPNYAMPKLKVIDPITLDGKDVPARRWIVKGWVPHGNVTMISGDGAVGKSVLALQLLTCCASGQDWLGLPTERCRALGVFCEDDPDELHRRQCQINTNYGLSFADLEDLQLSSRTAPMDENALMTLNRDVWRHEATRFYEQVHAAATEFGAQLIVLDSLHDLFEGNENARPEVRRFVQLLRALASDIDGAVVITAHPSLSGMTSGTGQSGSTAWNNSVRSRLYLTRPKDDGSAEPDKTERVLSRMKANYGRDSDDTVLRLRMQDGAFVSPVDMNGQLGAIEKRRAEDVFLSLLRRRSEENRPVSHKPRSGNYAPKEFARSPNREGFQRRDFERAMEALFSAGTIQVDDYKSNGRTCQKIVEEVQS